MIANHPPSPLHVSELGKFEESDFSPETVTAKSEHVTVSHRSEETDIGLVAVDQRPRKSPPAQAKCTQHSWESQQGSLREQAHAAPGGLGKETRRLRPGLTAQRLGPHLPVSSCSHVTRRRQRA